MNYRNDRRYASRPRAVAARITQVAKSEEMMLAFAAVAAMLLTATMW